MTSRPIPGRNETMSYSDVNNCESATVLTYLLNNTRPAELHDLLLMPIQRGGLLTRDIENLLHALQTVGVVTAAAEEAARDITDRHCVRCHQSYLERNNGLKACTVPHDAPRKIVQGNPAPGQPAGFKDFYPCCNGFADPGRGPQYPHFIGRHTTKQNGVFYTNTNIVSCEQKKCFAPAPTPVRAQVQQPTKTAAPAVGKTNKL